MNIFQKLELALFLLAAFIYGVATIGFFLMCVFGMIELLRQPTLLCLGALAALFLVIKKYSKQFTDDYIKEHLDQ